MVATTKADAPKGDKTKKSTAAARTAEAAKTTKSKASAKKVDKVDTTARKDETKVRPSKAEMAKTEGGIRLDPNLPLIPGNSVTFVAEEREGRVQAKIVTSKDSWIVAASNGRGDARVSKILEVPGEITVEFYEDGKMYASGSWQVG